MSNLLRVEAGDAVLFQGDTRFKQTDMDKWLATLLEPKVEGGLHRPYLYGSDAGFCARRNALLEHNEWLDSNVNSAGSGYMAIGVAFENLLADALRRAGKLIAQSQRIVEMPELKISGKIDFVLIDSQGHVALAEIKTCGELPSEPKPSHLAQIQTYSAVSGVRRCWLTYMSRNLNPRNPIPLRTFLVDTSQEALVNRLRIAFLSRMSSDVHALVPVPTTFRKHTECHYCEFRDYFCYGSRPGLGNDNPTSPMKELTPEQYIVLDNQALNKAIELYQSIDLRELKTLNQLLDTCIDYNQRKVLEETLKGLLATVTS